MSKSIRLSEKHGVNPCIPVCFWCGKSKNEIALLGKLKDDSKAPMNAVLDREPCDECKELMSRGVTLAESSDGQEPLHGGRWLVVSDNFIKNAVNNSQLAEDILNKRIALVDPAVMTQIVGDKECAPQ